MTIVNDKLYFSQDEMEQMNTFSVMMSALGLTCAPWQHFGFSADLCNAAITISTIAANAEKITGGWVFDPTTSYYGSEYEEQGFAVGDAERVDSWSAFLAKLEEQAIEDSVVADITLTEEDKKWGWD